MAIELRPYQASSIDALREGIRAGHKRQILCCPTGGGKTEVGMALIQEAVAKYSKTAFICDRIAILDQTSERFDKNAIEHGIIQAGHWRWRPYERAQICSAQTLARRGIVEGLRLIIVDEAHTLFKTTTQFILAHPEIVTIGLTATPFTKGLGEIYTNIVNITTTNELIAGGYLAPLRVFAAKAVDMRGARIKSTGEWEEKEMEKRGLEKMTLSPEALKDKLMQEPLKQSVSVAVVDALVNCTLVTVVVPGCVALKAPVMLRLPFSSSSMISRPS